MTLAHILLLAAAALLAALLGRGRWRGRLMLGLSILALYWLQPSTPIRHLDFWLPTASLALTIGVWVVTRPPAPEAADLRPALMTAATITLVVVAIALTRYLGWACCLTASRPPGILSVLLALGLAAAIGSGVARFVPNPARLAASFSLLVVGLFLMMKVELFGEAASAGLRALTGQPADQASALDLRWLGFSYLAFRLLHALRDRASGRLPALSLQEFVTYALFFPALTAGPIDRSDRFVKDLRQPFSFSASEALEGGKRIVVGLFKKFALADTLALIALNRVNAAQTTSAFWAWMLLYAYAWRLYLDFSGYTDIAIGLGRLFGVRLPENFERPYLKPNLTTFWNSWHITLAQWFRAYFFNPLTRALRSRPRPLPAALIILIGQVGTMLLIGLWHGVTWNFVAWGAWHAAGLFVHNRWAEFARARLSALDRAPVLKRAARLAGVALTFHYVTLGWVWFALPSPDLSQTVFQRLFGL